MKKRPARRSAKPRTKSASASKRRSAAKSSPARRTAAKPPKRSSPRRGAIASALTLVLGPEKRSKPKAKHSTTATSRSKASPKRSSAKKAASSPRRAAKKGVGAKRAASSKSTTKRPGAKRAAARRGTARKAVRTAPTSKIRSGATTRASSAARSPARRTSGARSPVRKSSAALKARSPGSGTSAKAQKPVRRLPAKALSKRVPASKVPAARQAHKSPAARVPFRAYSGAKPYIFVSYAHRNMSDVFPIIRKLDESRFRMWYDEGIEPGNEWPEVVGKAVLGCSQLLVFMSRAASQSRNVRNEVNLAFGSGKNIVVVYLEKTTLSEGMRLQVGSVQSLNWHEIPREEFLDRIKRVLRSDESD